MSDLGGTSSTNSSNNWWYNHYGNYPKMEGIPRNFTIEDYEVFQVIKK